MARKLSGADFSVPVDLDPAADDIRGLPADMLFPGLLAIFALAQRMWESLGHHSVDTHPIISDFEGPFWIALEVRADHVIALGIEYDPDHINPVNHGFLVRRNGQIRGLKPARPGSGPSAYLHVLIASNRDASRISFCASVLADLTGEAPCDEGGGQVDLHTLGRLVRWMPPPTPTTSRAIGRVHALLGAARVAYAQAADDNVWRIGLRARACVDDPAGENQIMVIDRPCSRLTNSIANNVGNASP